MHFSKDKISDTTPHKFKYKTHKEYVRLTLVDDDCVNRGEIPIYDGHTPKTDPFGSYTGVCDDPYEVPVQDVDDL